MHSLNQPRISCIESTQNVRLLTGPGYQVLLGDEYSSTRSLLWLCCNRNPDLIQSHGSDCRRGDILHHHQIILLMILTACRRETFPSLPTKKSDLAITYFALLPIGATFRAKIEVTFHETFLSPRNNMTTLGIANIVYECFKRVIPPFCCLRRLSMR